MFLNAKQDFVKLFSKQGFVSKKLLDTPEHSPLNWVKKILILTIAAFIFYIAFAWFISRAGLIIGGVGGISAISSYIAGGLLNLQDNTKITLNFIIQAGLNIPLIIFGWLKVGKKFAILSMYAIIAQVAFALIFQNFYPSFIDHSPIKFDGDSSSVSLIFFDGIIGGILIGFASVLCYSVSACGGGFDFIYIYLSIYKKKAIGSTSLVVNFFIITIGTLLLQIDPGKFLTHVPSINPENTEYVYRVLGPGLIGTLMYIFVASTVVDSIFPKAKKVEMQIYTNKPQLIIDVFKQHNYRFNWTEVKGKGGFTNNEISIITTATTYYEYKQWVPLLKQVDKNVFITIKGIQRLEGTFTPYKFN